MVVWTVSMLDRKILAFGDFTIIVGMQNRGLAKNSILDGETEKTYVI